MEKKLPEVMRLLNIMIEKFPTDESAINEHNYFQLLTKQGMRSALQSAINLHKTNPKMMAFRITLALAYLRVGSPERAYNLLNSNDLDWKKMESLRKAVRAAVLIQNGQATEAQELIKFIYRDALFPEELELFHPY